MKHIGTYIILYIIAEVAGHELFDFHLTESLLGLLPESVVTAIQRALPDFILSPFFLIEVLLLFFGLKNLFIDLPKLRQWEHTKATVTQTKWWGRYIYSYTFNETNFEGYGTFDDVRPKIGETISIYLNPAAPTKSDLRTPSSVRLSGIIMLIFALLIVIGAISSLTN